MGPLPCGQTSQSVVAPVTNDELIVIAKSFRLNKAPGPASIPTVAMKTVIKASPDMHAYGLHFNILYAASYTITGDFPERWKRQSLVLLPKPGKPPGDPSAYRPIGLLDTAGRQLERIILTRLTVYAEKPDDSGFSDNQFSSTVDAVRAVTKTTKIAIQKKRTGIRYWAVVTQDVKNAFNSVSWATIECAIHHLGAPDSLCRILESYFQNGVLIYDTDEGERSCNITAGVPQGSIQDPVLWNAAYDGVLKLDLPQGVKLVGFADDFTLVVYGESIKKV